ncbi:MAG: PEP-CTERM sorting domain-containing protein [Phycisphaerae bacterium]|nr:PEP-CTERM sorting domain-containing protein [Phycisphaerae bacterium]
MRTKVKRTRLILGLLSLMALSILAITPANAGVIASDDFSSVGSGTGWAAGSSWSGGSLGPSGFTVFGATSFRPFASSVTDSNNPLYIGFDFTRNFDSWAGVSLFNGSSEELFMGRPFQQSRYGGEVSDPSQGLIYLGNVSVDTSAHRMVTQIDFGGGAGPGEDRIRFWVDNSTEAAPDATVDVDGSWLPSLFTQLRIGSNGSLTVDNLTVSTSFGDSYAGVPEPATMSLLALGGVAALRRRRKA